MFPTWVFPHLTWRGGPPACRPVRRAEVALSGPGWRNEAAQAHVSDGVVL